MDLKKKIGELHDKGFALQEIALKLNLHEDEVTMYLPDKPNLTPKVRSIVRAYREHPEMTVKELATHLGITYQHLSRSLKLAGIDGRERTRELEKKRNEELKASIREMYEAKVPLRKMEEELGISGPKIRQLAIEMGITLRHMRKDRRHEQVEYLLSRRLEGASYRQIAEELGISPNYVNNLASYARKNGFPVPCQRKEKDVDAAESTNEMQDIETQADNATNE